MNFIATLLGHNPMERWISLSKWTLSRFVYISFNAACGLNVIFFCLLCKVFPVEVSLRIMGIMSEHENSRQYNNSAATCNFSCAFVVLFLSNCFVSYFCGPVAK